MVKANIEARPEYLLTNDAARVCDVAPQTIRLWERAGLLPAVKTERGVRLFDRRDVERVKRERDERRCAMPAPETSVGAR